MGRIKTPRTNALVDRHAKEYQAGVAALGHQYSELADFARELEESADTFQSNVIHTGFATEQCKADLCDAIEVLQIIVNSIPHGQSHDATFARAHEVIRKATT